MVSQIKLKQRKEAYEVLIDDAEQILRLIEVQIENFMMPQCPLYEEVLDTQMFGLSIKIMLHTNDINVLYYIKLLIEYINSFMLRWTKLKKRLKNYDVLLMITPILLAAFGVVMIYSASMVTAVADGLSSTYYLFKQLQW